MSLLRVYAAALFLAFPSAVVTAGPGETSSNVGLADLARVHIDNFGRVNANYYRGAQPQGRDYADLAALGVKTVINLTSHDAEPDERAVAEKAGMAYRQIPMTTRNAPTPEQLAEFLTIVNEPANQPVFVHCIGGKHRTGVMTAAYRMTQDRWTADQAFKEMKQYKFGADFLHPEFKAYVYKYPDALTRIAAGGAGATAAKTASQR